MTSGGSSDTRPPVAGDYLHACLALHGELAGACYGRRQQLDELEAAAAKIRCQRRFTYDEIEQIRDTDLWDADRFWHWPPRENVEQALAEQRWDFWHLPEKEDETIDALLRVFKFIEPVSVILRVVRPEHYGILSAPVEKLLEVRPSSSPLLKYLDYLNALRKLGKAHGLPAASVDMAIWVLQVGVVDGRLPGPRREDLWSEFRNDPVATEIRVQNLTRPLFSDMTRGELARVLLSTQWELAGEIAGIEFERRVRRLATAGQDEKLADLVRKLCSPGGVAAAREVLWKEAVRTRNKAVHKTPPPKFDQVRRLLEAMDSATELSP